MKTIIINLFLAFIALGVAAQGLQIKTGDQFPSIPIQNVINAPLKSFELEKQKDKKFYILNFWGTWCSPCIPEMDNLAKLQVHNPTTIQVIAISNEEPGRLINYLKKKPSKVWLASDTAAIFYQLFNLSYVGQSALVNAKGKVVALVRTDSINQKMIDRLIKGQLIPSNAQFKEKPVNTDNDIFGVDTTLMESFTVRGYMIGQRSMGKRYGGKSVYKDRRISYVNSSAATMYKDAYGIVSLQQLIYEIPEKEVSNFEDKQSLYCLDLLVKPSQKDSLYTILQQKLQQVMRVKARVEFRKMPVYALVNKGFTQKESNKAALSYGFSGTGYDGEGATLANFANDYLSNEFELPVIDETGLSKRYDIKTNVEMRTRAGVLKSINDIGLDLVKKDMMMKVIVFYK